MLESSIFLWPKSLESSSGIFIPFEKPYKASLTLLISIVLFATGSFFKVQNALANFYSDSTLSYSNMLSDSCSMELELGLGKMRLVFVFAHLSGERTNLFVTFLGS